MVAFAFVKNDDEINNTQVNHKNGYKTDNHYWNLEWMMPDENMVHAYSINLKSTKRGEGVPTSYHTEDEVKKVCELLTQNKSYKEISDLTGFSRDMIRAIYSKRTWTHISNSYDFSNYNFGKSVSENLDRINKINKVCEMLESNRYTIKEISEKTGIGYGMVIKIKNGESYKDISSKYSISNYINKSYNKKKK